MFIIYSPGDGKTIMCESKEKNDLRRVNNMKNKRLLGSKSGEREHFLLHCCELQRGPVRPFDGNLKPRDVSCEMILKFSFINPAFLGSEAEEAGYVVSEWQGDECRAAL